MSYAICKIKGGFTLIELLIVSALLSIVALATYATFTSGIKIWQRVNTPVLEEDVNIFFDEFSLDLRNSFKFHGIGFIGKKDKLAFPTLVNSSRLNKRTVGKVIYFYEPMTETLNKDKRDFAQVYEDERGIITQLLNNIISLRFQYYLYDKEQKEYFWLDEWSNEELPFAVRVNIEFNDGIQKRSFTKTVAIPTSGRL
jgi:prepilin-type N-terminal cleavage/methylation domain-containing protein